MSVIKNGIRVIIIGLVSCVFFGCASRPTENTAALYSPDLTKNQKIEPEARTLYYQAERAFSNRNYDEARRLYQQVKTKYPRGRAAMLSSYRLGTVHYYREDYALASREFEGFLARYPQSDLTFDVTYNMAAAEYQQGNYERASSVLQRLRPGQIQAQPVRRAEVVYQLQAQAASAMNNPSLAVSAYASHMQLPLDERKRSALSENVDIYLNKISNRAELDRLLAETTEPTVRNRITQRMSSLASVQPIGPGELAAPSKIDSPVSSSEPIVVSEPNVSSGSGERLNLGVILPLTGKFSPYGKKALDGILLAAKTYFKARDLDIRIFAEDSGGSPAMAQAAVDTLVNRYKVMGIIGPISWKESLAVANRALELGVLNLSLTGKEGISELGPYLFQNALTPRVQLENLLKYCLTDKQFRRFAILAPNNNFGRDMADSFWDLVEAGGGKVVAYQLYPAEEKDFQNYIQNLAGLSNPAKYRRFESGKLGDYVKEQKAKTGREPKVRLQPIVDYDALFIPDNPKAVASIAASLAYFDVSGMPLLGTTEWNSDQLYKRGGKYVEGAIFPGGVSLGSKNTRQREFIRLYTEAFGNAPDLLASQAFEAMEIVTAGLKKSSSSRNDFVQAVASLKELESPLGTMSFDSARIAKRKIPVFTLEAGGTVTEQ